MSVNSILACTYLVYTILTYYMYIMPLYVYLTLLRTIHMCTIRYHTIPYCILYLTVYCTLLYTIPYCILYLTILYLTVYCTLPYYTLLYTIPYCILYLTVYYTLLYTVPYCILYLTVYCTLLYTIPYHTIPYYISLLCHTYAQVFTRTHPRSCIRAGGSSPACRVWYVYMCVMYMMCMMCL